MKILYGSVGGTATSGAVTAAQATCPAEGCRCDGAQDLPPGQCGLESPCAIDIPPKCVALATCIIEVCGVQICGINSGVLW